MTIHFPLLSPEMHRHSQAVLNYLQHEIKKAGGHISFAHFMKLALYAPGLGYYTSGSYKLGERGDFVTAAEISPLFAKTLAGQFAAILETLPQGSILELGAGTGIFATEVLLELEKRQALPVRYFILEPSAELVERQKNLVLKTCPRFLSRLVWLDQLPETFRGIIFANEVLDALPVHCFRIENKTVKERCVAFNNNELVWKTTTPLSVELHKKVLALMKKYNLPSGYESEINLLLPRWIKTLANLMQEGVVIFFDYGYGRHEYYHPDRFNGTLRCYFQHRMHTNPFLYPGLQDMTANVDFTMVVKSALRANLDLAGYTTQGVYLMSNGITDGINTNPASINAYQQNQALKRLLFPSEMGNLVKTIAFTKNWKGPLKGFSQFDQRREL